MNDLLETTVASHLKRLDEHEKMISALSGMALIHDRAITRYKLQIENLTQRLAATEQQLNELRTAQI